MAWPGPGIPEWVLGLLLFAASLVVIGDGLRRLVARFAPLFRFADPIELLVVNLYLGVLALYVVAALPFGWFGAGTLPVLLALGAVGGLALTRSSARSRRWLSDAARSERTAWAVVGILSLTVFAIECWAAGTTPTGNTYDNALYTLYTAALLQHHSIPTTLAPFVGAANVVPQGATVVFASNQLLFGLPPSRTALLVTPLFLGVLPMAAYVWGRRWFDSPSAGIAFAVAFGLLGAVSRELVIGSNDFVLALPLALVLVGTVPSWTRDGPPTPRDAVAFGLLTGTLAALNPVAAEWWLIALPAAALVTTPRLGGAIARWWAAWSIVAGLTVVLSLPALLAIGSGGPSAIEPSTPGTAPGISVPQFLSSIDPYLVGAGAPLLSGFLLLQVELILLLTAGAALLLIPPLRTKFPELRSPSGRWFAVLGGVAIAGLGVAALARSVGGPLGVAVRLTSREELSYLLFAVFTGLAAAPLFALLERAFPRSPAAGASRSLAPSPAPVASPRSPAPTSISVAPFLLAALLVAPGLAITGAALPEDLSNAYAAVGNVTAADLALLDWSHDHLPSGARVLVAPGSAAQFLPGYDATVVVLYPVLSVGVNGNASYRLIVSELTNGTLDASARTAFAALQVEYVAVTGANTILWPPFAVAPLLAAPEARLQFHQGDAWLFSWTWVPTPPGLP